MTPRLSVVVPFYNVGDYIADCLDSIARQTFTDFEAILVDDGSLDQSAALAKEFCEADRRFRIVSQENQGLGPARNTGLLHAQGEYITFVDSDDLVTRHAYEKLVGSLDRSGSSFAGGNARRFNNSFGVRPSWVQRIPFAKDRTGTHISDFPDLVLDRTVWNKVYRRSFWDRFGYRFPAIRYEDYPVTLKAHLDAVTVDCLAAPVYYWRERESGESITQQKFKYSNLLDRVTSAELVMDLLDERAEFLRPKVHAHLAQVDLLALVQAFSSVPAEEEQWLVELGRRLVGRLDAEVLAATPTFDRLQQHALIAGDIPLLRELAQFRQDSGLRGGSRAVRRPDRPWQLEFRYPGLGSKVVPRNLYRMPQTAVTLFTQVLDVSWRGTDLVINGTAEIRHLPTTERTDLRIRLDLDDDGVDLPVRRFETRDSHGDQSWVGFEVTLGADLLARVPHNRHVPLSVRVRRGRVEREGPLRLPRAGSPGWPPGEWIGRHDWVQPGLDAAGAYAVRRIRHPWRLTGGEVRDGAFEITGRLTTAAKDPKLLLTRTLSGETSRIGVTVRPVPGEPSEVDFTARIPLDPIVDDANPDDPFTQRTSRGVQIVAGGSTRALMWMGPDLAVGEVHRDRLLMLTRSSGNFVNLHESLVRLGAERVTVADERLVFSGPLWEESAGMSFQWRRYLEDSDDHVDVECRRWISDGWWHAEVNLTDLVPEFRRVSVDPLASQAEWVLFATAADGSAKAVQSEPAMNGRLPIEITVGAADTVRISPRAGTLHLEVY